MAARKYTNAQKRTIRLALRDGLSAKVTADKVNALKSTLKTGDTVTSRGMSAAFKRCTSEKWGE
jgi:hypothetical protein